IKEQAKYIANKYYHEKKLMFKNLDGAFSLIIIDKVTKQIYLLTDPFGKKKMYYSLTGTNLFFASSLSNLDMKFLPKIKINEKAVIDFFSYYFIPAPLTIYKDVYKLLPSELITYSIKEKSISKEKYW